MPLPHRPEGPRNDFTGRFCAPLLDPERPTPRDVTGPRSKAADKRYDVYRNNVTVSLIDTLGETYPAVQRIVGRTFFRDMARIFVRAEPPRSPLLFEYGRGFSAFIDDFEHTASMPWLGDVARIERAWLDAYHAADAPPLAPETLANVPAESLSTMVFTPHPAMRVVRSAYPAVTIFAANRQSGPVGKILERGGEDALVTRPHLELFVRKLPPGGAVFLVALCGGRTLGEAAAEALDREPRFDLGANIAAMLEAGAFTAVEAANC
ncbi:HvfC/BufC N-terminal domain-containing protein [Mesorhizobium xinjiangense]|uniref:HvfC/BufC N-terminal domain-containing protein n=1 Tax=Mesorhizobium xinjiangense TaxID=2678685 RepID=UPI0012ECEB73|nr:DNA-binding domain-containing protein [Mesorhizobium xinjiangense]